MFFTDHGGRINNQSCVFLWGNDYLLPSELNTYLSYIPNDVKINIVMEQCYSGGFINTLSGINRTISTACSENEVSYSAAGIYDDFVYHWTNAIAGITPNNVQVDADINKDGYISMEEAFTYAQTNDYNTFYGAETPQYYSNPDIFGYRYDIIGDYSLLPTISGGEHLSTVSSAIFSVNELPDNAIVNWYVGSSNSPAGTGNPASLNAYGFNALRTPSTLRLVVTTADGGVYPEDIKNIMVWKPGIHMNNALIYVDEHLLSLTSNPIGATGFLWDTNASNVTLGSQGVYMITFDVDYGEEPDFTQIWVSFRNPLGEYTVVVKNNL